MQNIEVKSRLSDWAGAEAKARELGAAKQWCRQQRDTFFDVPRGFLKLREEQGQAPVLISYERATDDSGLRPSDYDLREVADAKSWIQLLDRVTPVLSVVEKERTLWLWRHTRIHFDQITGLGTFLEIESVANEISRAEAEAESKQVFTALGLRHADLIAVPYRDLLAQKKAASRSAPG